MGNTFKTGNYVNGIFQDASNNIGIGGSPSGSYKFEVTGTSNFTGALRTASTINMTGTGAQLLQTTANSVAGDNVMVLYNSNANSYGLYIGAGSGTNHALYITDSTRTANLFKVQGNGNVGIGTSSPSQKLEVYAGASDGVKINALDVPSLFLYAQSGTVKNWGIAATNLVAGDFGIYQSNSNGGNPITAGTSRLYITSGGFTKMSNTGSYYSSTGPNHELRSDVSGDWNTIMTSTSGNPYGLLMGLIPGISNTGNEFISAYTSNFAVLKFKVASNGGIYNYQSNDSNLSDERTKKDITPLESYWNKFKAIEIVKFKYKEQGHDDYNIGVIAQQVESVAPEFINEEGWGDIPEDGIPLKSVYTADLYHATIKVLQEAMAKIEELEDKVSALENR